MIRASFGGRFFRKNFTAKELTPEILIAICDSVNEETQKFGRDLLLEYFEEENGVEYLLKLSEHPSAAMQLVCDELFGKLCYRFTGKYRKTRALFHTRFVARKSFAGCQRQSFEIFGK